MRPRLYISWGAWLGARAAALVDAATRAAYDSHASCFYSAEIRYGEHWFGLNEGELDKASAAAVLITSDGLQSHWQAYELGRLRGRGVPCVLLLLDVSANTLGPTAYTHLNCASATNDVLLQIIRAGFDANGASEDSRGHRTEQQAVHELGIKLRHLLDAFAHLQKYKSVTGRSKADRISRNIHIEKAVYGFCSAGLSEQEIADRLVVENVPGAAYIDLFETSPCRALPRTDSSQAGV